MTSFFKDKNILITGGVGTLGNELTKQLLDMGDNAPNKIIIFSRNDLRQDIMRRKFNNNPKLRWIVGDVTDYNSINYALRDVDHVIHAAALKIVPSSEYNVLAYTKNIVGGAENIIKACINNNVKSCVALSTDKSCLPINAYGYCKALSDSLFINGNCYVSTIFNIIRYGNIIMSNGSVLSVNHDNHTIPIYDNQMTRFWLTIQRGAELTLKLLSKSNIDNKGLILIPKIPTINVLDMIKTNFPNAILVDSPVRAGEKRHEIMIGRDSYLQTVEYPEYFIINQYDKVRYDFAGEIGCSVNHDFSYSSDNNPWVLTDPKDIKSLIDGNMPTIPIYLI